MVARVVQFQAFELCVAFVALASCRVTSRASLSTKFRSWLQEKLPDWANTVVLFLSQWWALLAVVLIVELVTTKANIVAVVDATVNAKGDRRWLAALSRWACPACLATYALGLLSVGAQVTQAWRDAASGRAGWHRGLKWVLRYPRDVAIQVLFMPMVYHLMMCRSLLRRWRVLSAQAGETVEHQNLMAAEADASLAEMYDAYALWCFGNLGMYVAERELRRQTGIGQSSVFSVLQGTLMFGVKAYVVTAVLGALYSIGLASVILTMDPSLCKVAEDDSGVCTFTQIMYGADFATSTIAIYNLFSFEHELGGPLEKFQPATKFWSMKIPVTISFSELMLLKLTQPLTRLEDDEMKLLDTITKAYFMLLVAFLNVIAWKPWEEWYYWEELCEEGDDDGGLPCCCGGSGGEAEAQAEAEAEAEADAEASNSETASESEPLDAERGGEEGGGPPGAACSSREARSASIFPWSLMRSTPAK